MQDDPAHDLDRIRVFPDDTKSRLTGGRKRFDQQVIQAFTLSQPVSKLGRLGFQLIIR